MGHTLTRAIPKKKIGGSNKVCLKAISAYSISSSWLCYLNFLDSLNTLTGRRPGIQPDTGLIPILSKSLFTHCDTVHMAVLYTIHIGQTPSTDIRRAWCKTIVTPYIKWGSYNSFAPSPNLLSSSLFIENRHTTNWT